MEQVAIYPYNESYAPVVRHQKLMRDMRIKSLISPKGWGLNGECIKTIDVEYLVSDNFLSEIESCTAVWFVEDDNIPLPSKTLKEKLNDALKQNKKIIYTRSSNFEDEDIKKIIQTGKEIRIQSEYTFPEIRSKACFNIKTPVIFVLGLSENTDKFEVQLALREQFIQNGYKVSSISSRRDSAILGMHPLPSWLLDDSTSETNKIISYNHLIKNIELDENPEVIIIGIPGGVFPFSKSIHNYFGISTYEISNAVTCDCAVFCSPYLDYSLDMSYFSRMSTEVNRKFGFTIDHFHIAARTYDYVFAQPFEETFSWITLDEQFIDEKIEKYESENVYNLLKTTAISELTSKIIDQLSETPKAQSI